jgi:hypothetical protein
MYFKVKFFGSLKRPLEELCTSHFYRVATLVTHCERSVDRSPACFTHSGGSEVGRSHPHFAHWV